MSAEKHETKEQDAQKGQPLDEWFGVTSLELGGNDLSSVLPESLDGLTHLQENIKNS